MNTNKKAIKFGVVIGRMNPPHKGHKHLIDTALQSSDFVIVCLGSAKSPRTPKDPFTAAERQMMVSAMYDADTLKRIQFTYVRDYHYSDADWLIAVRTQVSNIIHATVQEPYEVTLFGYEKDNSSSYIKWFKPQWKYAEVSAYEINGKIVNATNIREHLFDSSLMYLWKFGTQTFQQHEVDSINFVEQITCKPVIEKIQSIFNEHEYVLENLIDWKNDIEAKRKIYGEGPFVTGDAVVYCNGYVLTVTRGGKQGRGLLALPGGFLEAKRKETLKQCILRELKEETSIDVPPRIIEKCLKTINVYDAPNRSLRGQTITHAGIIVLDEPTLPKVKAGSDALHVEWLPIEFLPKVEERFFDDHYHIISSNLTIK